MATVINNPSGGDSGSGMGTGLIIGIIVAVLIIIIVFFVYGWPALQGNQGGSNVNVEIPDLNQGGDQGGQQGQ